MARVRKYIAAEKVIAAQKMLTNIDTAKRIAAEWMQTKEKGNKIVGSVKYKRRN